MAAAVHFSLKILSASKNRSKAEERGTGVDREVILRDFGGGAGPITNTDDGGDVASPLSSTERTWSKNKEI